MYMARGKLTWKKLDGGRREALTGIFIFPFVGSWAFNRRLVGGEGGRGVPNVLALRVFLRPEKPTFLLSNSTRIEDLLENQLKLIWLPL